MSLGSGVYNIEPEDVQFDDKYVVFNPMQTAQEYEATFESIKQIGQLDPILMLNGKCIDGRHRTRIARELGVQVAAIDVDPDTSMQDLIITCNKNIMSGRDYDLAQKAIQALSLVNNYEMTVVSAAKFMKIDRRMVSYAATIKGYGQQQILDALMADKTNRVQLENMERPSRSLELLAKFVKTLDEKGRVIVNDSERVQWKPDALIKTEQGKAWCYEQMEAIKLHGDNHLLGLLIELANLKFTLKDVDVPN